MKIITENNAEITHASTALSAFPASRVFEEGLKRRWLLKAFDPSPSLELSVSGPSDCLLIDGVTGAVGAVVTIENGGVIQTENILFSYSNSYGTFDLPRAWMEYPVQAGTHSITIDFTGNTIGVGIVFVGKGHGFPNPQWGLNPNSKSYAIREDLENGFEFATGQNRNQVRNFSGTILHESMDAYLGFQYLMESIYPEPFVCRVLDGFEPAAEWAIYGALDAPPKKTLSRYNNYPVNFNMTEKL